MDLPFESEENQKLLRSYSRDLENISESNKKINTNEILKKQLKDIDLHEAKRLLALHPELQDTSQKLQAMGAWRSEKMFENTMIKKYEDLTKLEDMDCPTCGSEIDTEFVERMLKEHRERLEQCEVFAQKDQGLLKEIEEANEIHRNAGKTIQDWENLYRSIDNKLPSTVTNKDDLETKIVDLRQKIMEEREELQKVIDENERRERHNTRIGIILEQTEQFQSELDVHKSTLEKSESNLAILETLKKAFSTNGLLAYKIESLVKELEILTNDYLAEFSDGRFAINFVVENDKLNVEVSDNGNIIDILALSSGELARVNIATLVSIRKLMTSISRSQINVLFLDEVNQALDEVGKEKVVEVLLKEENLNTYMVSHGWTHPLLEKIEITKDENISYLEG